MCLLDILNKGSANIPAFYGGKGYAYDVDGDAFEV
jgi:hypothetical protein